MIKHAIARTGFHSRDTPKLFGVFPIGYDA